MQPRFDTQELYALRNDIPIRWLISTKLATACKTSADVFRFQCPQCNCFHTSVSCATNLARCFHCRRSFNPIDFLMASRRLNFIESVTFLRRCREELGQKPQSAAAGRGAKPTSINEILSRIALSAQERRR